MMCDCFCPAGYPEGPLELPQPVNLRILLLGAGDSGKSTFFRQLKLRYLSGFPSTDVIRNSNVLRNLSLSSMQKLLSIQKCVDNNPKFIKMAKLVLGATTLTPEVAKAIESLWETQIVKKVFQKRSKYDVNLPTNSEYYFKNATRFAEDPFRPNALDHSMVKLMTTGVNELTWLDGKGNSVTVVDVGGTLPTRRKWPQLADNQLTSIIYFVSLADNSISLEEDPSRNRLEDSLDLFENVCCSAGFSSKDWVLLFNKQDLVYDHESDEFERICDGMVDVMKVDTDESGEPISWEIREVLDESSSYKSLMDVYIRRFRGQQQPMAIRSSSVNRDRTYKVFDAILERFMASQIKNNKI